MSLEDFTDVDESDEAAAADESVPSRSDPNTEVEPDDDFEEYSVAVDGEDVGLGALSVAQGLRVSEEADDTTLRAFVVTGNRDSVRLGKYLLVPYPDEAEEARIVTDYGKRQGPQRPADLGVCAVAEPARLTQLASALDHVEVAGDITGYVVRLVRATRENADLSVGASPRAAVMLAHAARARAALQGRAYVIPDDVKALAVPVLRHRLTLSPAAEIEGRDMESLVAELVESTEAPR